MDKATLTVKVNIPWHVIACFNAQVFIANIFNIKIDVESLVDNAVKKSKITVE